MAWVNWNGKTVKNLINKGARKASHGAAKQIGALADQQVPHDEGWLQGSKTIRTYPDKPITQIGYGGGGNSGYPLVPYALKWHEVEANFQKGRKSQYLADPAKAEGLKALERHLQSEFRKIL